jgi:ABC-type branched-subunit amino acid transport system permease subunit
LREQCGCTAGAVALGAFVVAFLAYALLVNPTAFSSPRPSVVLLQSALLVLGLVVSALLGKLTGLWFARRRYHNVCFELQARLRSLAQQQPEPGIAVQCCGTRR